MHGGDSPCQASWINGQAGGCAVKQGIACHLYLITLSAQNQDGVRGNRKKKKTPYFSATRVFCSVQKLEHRILQQIVFLETRKKAQGLKKKYFEGDHVETNYQKKLCAAVFVVTLLILACVSHSQAAYPYDFESGSSYGGSSIWQRILQHLFAAILGGIMGSFFSQRFKKYRRWFFLASIAVGALVGIYSNIYLGNIAFFILGFTVAYLLLRIVIAKAKKTKRTTFGSAEWADLEHLAENNLIGKEGFNLGVFQEGNLYPLHYKGDRHLLTVAPTRSGKGVSSIIPNLLTYKGSAVVIDPKGENALITAARRGQGDKKLNIEGLGQKVHVVDPWGITGLPSSHFNPLEWLNPDDEDINENAMILADSIITPHTGNRDSFWDEEAKALLMGILLWVALDESEKENRTLGRVRDIISLGEMELNDLLDEMKRSPNSIVCSTAARTLSKEEKLKSSVLASLQAHTHFLDSPRIRESLSVSDFRFEDLKTTRMSVYLVLPADRLETFGRWLRLLIQQALTVNARNIGTKPDKPVLFLLDEMASLGRLTMVEQAYSLMAGFGVQLWGIIQDLSQLERIYGIGWQTFIGNSGVLQYFGSRDLKTAEYFSKLCGVTTIEKFAFAHSIARAIGFSSSNGSSNNSSNTTTTDSTTWDVAQRNLAYPDELMVLRNNKQLVFVENANPIPARKNPWYENEDIMRFGVNLHGNKNEKPRKQTAPPPEREKKPLPTQQPQQVKEVEGGQNNHILDDETAIKTLLGNSSFEVLSVTPKPTLFGKKYTLETKTNTYVVDSEELIEVTKDCLGNKRDNQPVENG